MGDREIPDQSTVQSSPSSSSAITEPHLVLLALADSYLNTAHKTGIRADFDGELYQTLVTAGIRCLEGALYQFKLQPRFEAALRLRYAAVLEEETENVDTAEQILHKGILIANRNNFLDLKYAMQHLLVRIMFRMKPKAAFILLNQVIHETEVLNLAYWTYAFRFLLSSLRTQRTGEREDNIAVTSLRSVATLARQREDYQVLILANLMEASILLGQGISGVDAARKALGRAQSIPQQDAPQLVFFYQMLDIMTSTVTGATAEGETKMKVLQENLDTNPHWKLWPADGDFVVPVKSSNERTKPEGLHFKWLPKADLWSLAWYLSGMTRTTTNGLDKKAEACLARGAEMIEGLLSGNVDTGLYSVEAAGSRTAWRKTLRLSLSLQLIYCYASRSSWEEAVSTLRQAEIQFSGIGDDTAQQFLKPWLTYTTAVVRHGTGNLNRALASYQTLLGDRTSELGILSALNSALILAGPRTRNLRQANDLVAGVSDYAAGHRNLLIQGAFNVVKVALEKKGDNLNVVRSLLGASNRIFRQAGVQHMLTITLSLVCARVFNPDPNHHSNMSRATLECAMKSGDRLWQATTRTMLADALARANRDGEAKEIRAACEQDKRAVENYLNLGNNV